MQKKRKKKSRVLAVKMSKCELVWTGNGWGFIYLI